MDASHPDSSKTSSTGHLSHVDLTRPRYDQSTYLGRAKHFFEVTDPRNVLATSKQLEEAKRLILNHKAGRTSPQTTEEQLWRAKRLYDSAFHPDTGDKMLLFGRMSFQVPGNMAITGCMITFYRSPLQAIFWQWANQSFNAAVNYTNRSGDSIARRDLLVPYLSATGGAVATALVLNKLAKGLPSLIGRLVPFVAVAAANCINIPLMRQNELKKGIVVTDSEGTPVGDSKNASKRAISMVIVSRISLALQVIFIPQLVMDRLERRFPIFKVRPSVQAVFQVGMVGLCLCFATPLCCALFPQQSSMKVSDLELGLRRKLELERPTLNSVYFNKGL